MDGQGGKIMAIISKSWQSWFNNKKVGAGFKPAPTETPLYSPFTKGGGLVVFPLWERGWVGGAPPFLRKGEGLMRVS